MEGGGEAVLSSRVPLFTTVICKGCSSQLEFIKPKEGLDTSKIKVKCYKESCGCIFPINGATPLLNTNLRNGDATASPNKMGGGAYGYSAASKSTNNSSNSKPTSASGSKFRIGTAEEPYSMEYYEVLDIPAAATTNEIKKKYYALAMKFHPDKNPGPEAEERFKKISQAYQVLSDPELRKKYNEFGPGKGSDPEGGFMDPEEFFTQQFGGAKFVEIIGEISIGKEFKKIMVEHQKDEDNEKEGIEDPDKDDPDKYWEKRKEDLEARKKEREERVDKLTGHLLKKLGIYLEEGEKKFKEVIDLEVEELKVQNYGVPLLHSIGYIYSTKAKEFLGRDELFGINNLFQNMKLKGRTLNKTFSTVKSAVEVHSSFKQIQEAEKRGMSPEDIEKLKEDAARKGLNALWKGSSLEIESVIRSVCDKTLSEIGPFATDKETLKKRAEALKLLGNVYQSCKDVRDEGIFDL